MIYGNSEIQLAPGYLRDTDYQPIIVGPRDNDIVARIPVAPRALDHSQSKYFSTSTFLLRVFCIEP